MELPRSAPRTGLVPWLVAIALFMENLDATSRLTSLNTLVYADLPDEEVGRAGAIASAAQQLSLSLGVALASLVVAWFIGPGGERDRGE